MGQAPQGDRHARCGTSSVRVNYLAGEGSHDLEKVKDGPIKILEGNAVIYTAGLSLRRKSLLLAGR